LSEEPYFEAMKKFIPVVLGVFLMLLGACSRDLDANMPKVSTADLISVTETTFECGGTVISDGGFDIIRRGICWSSTAEPTASSTNRTEDGTGIGTYRSKVTGLNPETRYYYRAYATNSEGTAYGEESSLVTKKTVSAPTVSTSAISSIELTTAESGGIITENGGDSVVRCGICWDTNPNPTTSSTTKVVLTYSTPVFNCTLANLKYSTKYYVRAFAVNTKGVSYGEEVSFTTKILPEIPMVSVVGNRFQMGSYNGFSNEQPMHWVTLSNFKIATTEVTVELWNAVMSNSQSRNELNNLPISNVSMNEAMDFITRLGLATNKNYRLPTESEWEYVAGEGSGTRTEYATGLNDSATFAQRAWYAVNAVDMIHPVGTLLPNKLGIYDLGGNVKEWCNDWYGDYSSSDLLNPKGPTSGTKKVLRGGSFIDPAFNCRTSIRQYMDPNTRNRTTGFRIAINE
jgi:formylglycine-generating enzyme required for sulfatase activity